MTTFWLLPPSVYFIQGTENYILQISNLQYTIVRVKNDE